MKRGENLDPTQGCHRRDAWCPDRELLRSPDRIWRWLDHSGGGQGGEKGLISGYISKVEPTVFAKRSDRGCEKEGGVKGDSTYFGLSNWNDGIA